MTGLNSILPKEHGNKFYSLPIIRRIEKDVCAIAAWDSSIHDNIHLNKVTDGKIEVPFFESADLAFRATVEIQVSSRTMEIRLK